MKIFEALSQVFIALIGIRGLLQRIGIGRSLATPPSHTTRHTGPYHGGSVWLHVVMSTETE